MKTLYLHIGTGKTGSTSIQATFNSLKDKQVHFKANMNGIKGVGNVENFIIRMNNTDCNKLIYSNEWLFSAGHDFISDFSRKLLLNFKVIVVLYIRRQDEFIISSYQERSKAKSKHSSFEPIALPNHNDFKAPNYYKVATKWAKYFGIENLALRVFSKDTLKDGCVVKDFADLVGVKVESSQVINKNTSVGLIEFKLGHLMKNLGIESELRKVILAEVPKSKKALPDREAVELYYKNYITSNVKLKNMLNPGGGEGLFSEDFNKYPSNRTDIWTEETANMAISHLLSLIKNRAI